MRRILTALLFATIAAGVAACSGGGDGDPTAMPDGSPTVRPGLDATEEVLLATLGGLGEHVLRVADVGPEYVARSNTAVSRRETAVANIGVSPLAEYINSSDLRGTWATLMTRQDPESGISSIIYAFSSPEGAAGLRDVFLLLKPADYPGATTIEHPQAESIEGGGVLTVYRLSNAFEGTPTVSARIIEYTWQQGVYAGQVILRYAGDVDDPNDLTRVVDLAKVQAARMATLPQQ